MGSAASVGVHQALRNGAALVTSGADVLELIGVSGANLTAEPRAPETARDRLSVHDRQVLDAVPVVLGAPAESIAKVAGLGHPERPRRPSVGCGERASSSVTRAAGA